MIENEGGSDDAHWSCGRILFKNNDPPKTRIIENKGGSDDAHWSCDRILFKNPY